MAHLRSTVGYMFPVDCFLGTRKLEILAWEQDEKNLKLIMILVVFPQVAELQRHWYLLFSRSENHPAKCWDKRYKRSFSYLVCWDIFPDPNSHFIKSSFSDGISAKTKKGIQKFW